MVKCDLCGEELEKCKCEIMMKKEFGFKWRDENNQIRYQKR
jgi:hypothetical protein